MRRIISITIIMMTLLLVILPNFTYADTDTLGLGDLDSYRGTSEESTELNSMAGEILGVIRTVGTILSVVMLMAIGIKYMVGSVEERADHKKTLVPYVIGAGILFTGSFLPQLIYNIVSQL